MSMTKEEAIKLSKQCIENGKKYGFEMKKKNQSKKQRPTK